MKKYEGILDSYSYKVLKPFVPFLKNINEKDIKNILNIDINKVDNQKKIKIYSIILCSYINLLEGLEKNDEKKIFYPLLLKHIDNLKENKMIYNHEFRNKLISCFPNISPNKSPDKLPDKSPNISPNKSPNKSPDKSPDKSPNKSPKKSPNKSPDK